MSLRKTTTAALVAASLALSSAAPASAGMPVAPISSGGNSAEMALGALLLIGLFAWVTTGSAKKKDNSGMTVTRNGGSTTGSFTLLKF
ncbi:hypothetical protein A9Q94_14225 [Rhodobacterales bacterium 56_14_T64]|nr:hypothetical protein A9Q94_14225 [Rhodobacterales bacterium 56_14_T64]